jgi:membrane-associated phospholipid phosphatase
MADVYANPIMVEALILSREGTITVPEPQPTYYEPGLPPIDTDLKQLERWEPWVRAYIAVGEMMQGLVLQPSGTNAFQVLSYKVTPATSPPTPSLIAEIQRPVKATFEQQIPLVLSWAELRDERAVEILAQIDPQYAFWSSIVYMHTDRTRRTLELINMVLQFCVYVEMRFKHALGCWRPVEYNAQVQPMITTPGHGSFPMGHATQAYAVAYVLKSLLNLFPDPTATPAYPGVPTIVDQLDRLVARITTNRVIAGVHFPVDSMAGRMLGTALGEYFVGRCLGGNRTFLKRTFIATGSGNAGIDNHPTTDFNPFNLTNPPIQDLDQQGPFYSSAMGPNIPPSPLMGYFWGKAREEWKGKFGIT